MQNSQLTLSHLRLPLLLAAIAAVLLCCHTGLSLYHHQISELPWLLRQLFDLDEENNLPTWFSGFILLIAASLVWLCARHSRQQQQAWYGQWYLLAGGFWLLAIDEVAGLHETFNSIIEMSWAIPAAAVVLALAISFVPFMFNLPKRTAIQFALAGAVFVSGSIGVELWGNALTSQELDDTLQYDLSTLAEEGMEMTGVILFIHALLDYMRGLPKPSFQLQVQ